MCLKLCPIAEVNAGGMVYTLVKQMIAYANCNNYDAFSFCFDFKYSFLCSVKCC